MGLVYLARDDNLEREVAIKVLPDEVARDPERLLWFEREAKVLASLNHPNIATVHGFESSPDGTRFLVLERIVGETLAERLRQGGTTLKEALGLGLQIGEALEAAHERGIVHRDLKPDNVMVTARGRVKVLDFGLATRGHAPDGDPKNQFVGTPGYASPEQVRGESVDARADIFALACVLYECLAGRRAFLGSRPAEKIMATLSAEPEWAAVSNETPEELRSLLKRCLDKNADARPSTIGDVTRILGTLAGEPSTATVDPASDGVGLPSLPAQVTRFIGRERELAECRELVRGGRQLTLLGVAGCGKTRLAIELAGRRRADFPDGVSFVDLAPLRDGAGVFGALAAALGIKESGEGTLDDSIVRALRGKRALLVLDNCEHLIASVAELSQLLLRACPDLSILTTSREALQIPGERTFGVEPLEVPMPASQGAPAALRAESVRFFRDRARLADPDFEVTDANAAAVSEICSRLDGIPLALELAAARLQLLSLDQIQARLADRFRLLGAPSRAAAQHHRTLHAAVDWSHAQMAEVERTLFRRLAVFSGGWTLEAAAAVAGKEHDEFTVLDLLTRLRNKSLVVVEKAAVGREPRYRYLETMREFALERLAEAGEEPSIRDGHAAYFSALAEATYPRLAGVHQEEGLARLAPEGHNFLEALDWCGRAGRDGKGLGLASHLWNFWRRRCEYSVGRRALNAVLDRAGAQERTAVRSRALYGAGWLASLQGDVATARSRMEESLDIARSIGDSRAEGRALSGLGTVETEALNYSRARQYALESLELNRRLGSSLGIAAALGALGNLAFRQGDFEASRGYADEFLLLNRESGDQEGIGMALVNLAEVQFRLGRNDEARRTLTECLRVSQAIQAKHTGSVGLANAGRLAFVTGDPVTAARLIGAAEGIWEATGYALVADDRAEIDSVLSNLTKTLGEERLGRARSEGAALSVTEALAQGIRFLTESDGESVTQ